MTKESEMMEEFLSSFANEGWEVNDKGKLILKSEDGKSEFAYVDYGNFNLHVDIREVSLKIGGDYYRLMEYPTHDEIEYVFVMPSIKGEIFGQEEGTPGVIYNSEGELNRSEDVENLPRTIDIKKTAELFLKQVMNKNFSRPILVKQE